MIGNIMEDSCFGLSKQKLFLFVVTILTSNKNTYGKQMLLSLCQEQFITTFSTYLTVGD